MNNSIVNNKLDALRQREIDLRTKIAAEVSRQQKRRARELERLRNVIGGALLAVAETNPDLKHILKQALSPAALPPGDRAFLKSKDWQ